MLSTAAAIPLEHVARSRELVHEMLNRLDEKHSIHNANAGELALRHLSSPDDSLRTQALQEVERANVFRLLERRIEDTYKASTGNLASFRKEILHEVMLLKNAASQVAREQALKTLACAGDEGELARVAARRAQAQEAACADVCHIIRRVLDKVVSAA